MVEGPGCTRNGRKVQIAVGKAATAAVHVADSNDASPSSSTSPLPHHVAQELSEQTLTEAFTVGKELFLVFSDTNEKDNVLRLHFGMNGSLNARRAYTNKSNQKKASGAAPWKQNKTPCLRLYFTEGCNSSCYTILEAWETTVNYKTVSADAARDKLFRLNSRDVCSALFNAQDAFTSLRQAGQHMSISDALLNQDIFPGVGNIIKIESLHRSLVDPRKIVNTLSDQELRRIVRHTRKFSMDWLNTGRAGTKLVYNQTVCGTCGGMTVKMQKIGGGGDRNTSGNGRAFMSRVTFWCTACQPLSSSLAAGNASNKENFVQHSTMGTTQPFSNQQHSSNINNNSAPVASQVQPLRCNAQCPQHGTKSIKLCRTRNSNSQNTLRIFFTCKLKGCQYFSWADATFPFCPCEKKTVLRVSKTERSGGRWFLCCSLGFDKSSKDKNGCGHFDWAKEEHLAPLGSHLSPLL